MIYFLLPAYNEGKNIGSIIKGINVIFPAGEAGIILVNDGSTDDTEEAARSAGRNLLVLTHGKNLGLGNALKTGFKKVMEIIRPIDALITLDADNTHPLDIAAKMIDELSRGKDIVIASRYCEGGKEVGLSFLRKIGSLMVNNVFELFFSYPGLKEYTCGYRGYSGTFLVKLREKYGTELVTEPNFPAGTEILLKSILLKPSISEVPMVLRYDLKKGKSKMKIVQTLFAYMKLIAKIKSINY